MSLSMSGRQDTNVPARTAGQYLSLIAGILLVLLAVGGTVVAGFSDVTGSDHQRQVIGFAVNPLSNLVHLVLGALGIAAYTGRRRARWYGVVLFLACAALYAYGSVVADNPSGNPLNINWPVNVLHAVFGLLGVLIALVPVKAGRPPSTAELK
ncbi:DUF4383 domain-containing protein [Kineococcus rubinsiae]|uniref:DUF4383 domain-containing protein n=1 Tax=Kineococcus rubinsiae TaxID=2609562 RepID=UPI001430DB48|nr:DUF4383 domain-containing protein [Kineococcus rubinsiae]NIZ89507.1 DUF4383 domain-containing protein [Kineococcus rubinsiae]